MKIIIFGSNGMLGNYITTFLKNYYEIIKINRCIFDVSCATVENILNILNQYNNEVVSVINCVGIIPQRNNMDDIKKYIKINTLFPHLLANCCQILNYNLIHVSTDCVYNGDVGNYSEDDIHNEKNIYGISKSLGEPSNSCVIRTSIIGEEIQNKKSLLEWVRSQNNGKINGFNDHYWNGMTCLQLAKIIHYIIEKNIFWKGVRHLFSPNIVSKYELVNIIIQKYNLNIRLNKINTNFVNKTLTSKYESFFEIPPIEKQVEELTNFKLF